MRNLSGTIRYIVSLHFVPQLFSIQNQCVPADHVPHDSDLDELVYIDSNKLAGLHTETERLEARIRELQERHVSRPPSPPATNYHTLSQDSRVVESQSRYIEDLEHVMADLRQSSRAMERQVEGLQNQLDHVAGVAEERLRARDARISRLEGELAAAAAAAAVAVAANQTQAQAKTPRTGRAGVDVGEIDLAVAELRANIMSLVEEQDKTISDLEAAVGLRDGRLEEYLVLVMEGSLNEMRKGCAREVQCLKMAVNKLEAVLRATARKISDEE